MSDNFNFAGSSRVALGQPKSTSVEAGDEIINMKMSLIGVGTCEVNKA